MARSCYVVVLKTNEIRGQALPVEDMDVLGNDEQRRKPVEDQIPVPLSPGEPD